MKNYILMLGFVLSSLSVCAMQEGAVAGFDKKTVVADEAPLPQTSEEAAGSSGIFVAADEVIAGADVVSNVQQGESDAHLAILKHSIREILGRKRAVCLFGFLDFNDYNGFYDCCTVWLLQERYAQCGLLKHIGYTLCSVFSEKCCCGSVRGFFDELPDFLNHVVINDRIRDIYMVMSLAASYQRIKQPAEETLAEK